jgi:hypothetical protein
MAYNLAARLYKASGERDERLESVILQDPWHALKYAHSVLRGPFPEAEPVIVQDPRRAYWYARYVLKSPWPEVESVIVQDDYWAMRYATAVLGLLTFAEIDRWKADVLEGFERGSQ